MDAIIIGSRSGQMSMVPTEYSMQLQRTGIGILLREVWSLSLLNTSRMWFSSTGRVIRTCILLPYPPVNCTGVGVEYISGCGSVVLAG